MLNSEEYGLVEQRSRLWLTVILVEPDYEDLSEWPNFCIGLYSLETT